MEVYSTEEQQVEAIKNFWRQNGAAIIGGVVVGLGALFGWNTYQDSVRADSEAASVAFAKVVEQDANDNAQLALEKAVSEFSTQHGSSSYNALAQLLLVRSAVDAGELAKAESLLTEVIPNLDSSVAPLASIRLARVQLAQDKLDQALATLEGISNAAFAAQRDELKGDVFAQKGETQAARSAYQAAMEAATGMPSPALQMKLDDLS